MEAVALDVWLSHERKWIYSLPTEQPCGPFGRLNRSGTYIMCSACHLRGCVAMCVCVGTAGQNLI